MTSRLTMERGGATGQMRGWDGSSLGIRLLGGADPLGFAAGDANLYRYVGNAPTDFADPSGLAKELPDVPLGPYGKVDLPEKELLDLLNIPKHRWNSGCGKALQILDNLANSLKKRFSQLNPSTAEYGTHYYRYLIEYYVYNQLYPKIISGCGNQRPNGPVPAPSPLPSGSPPVSRPVYVPGARPGDPPLQTNLPSDVPSPPGFYNPAPPSSLSWFDIGAGNDTAVDTGIVVVPLSVPIIIYVGGAVGTGGAARIGAGVLARVGG
jgi:hypothetical protein